MINENKYDLVLMDVGLPDHSGPELTRIIRKSTIKSISNIPIIALTGHAYNDTKKEDCLDSGMQEVISKPVNPFVLNAVITKHVIKY